MFCYALLNAFFDASDANFSLTRERSRPVYFPALQQKFQSRDKINFTPRRFLLEEPRAKSRLSPTRRQNSCRKQSQNLLALSGIKIAFPARRQHQPTWESRSNRFYPSKNSRKRAIECKTCACLDTSGPPSVPCRGCRRDRASVAPLRTSQTSTRLPD